MKTAFFDVDTQRDFMEPGGALYVKGAERLNDNLAALTLHARMRGIPLLASADAHPANDPEFAQFPPHCVAGTPGQKKISQTTIPGVAVLPPRPAGAEELGAAARAQEALFEKTTFDAFSNPNLDPFLKKIGADDWVVYGVATDYCVRAAALGLKQRGHRVRLVVDAIAAVTEETGRKALEEMKAAGITFTTTKEVLRG